MEEQVNAKILALSVALMALRDQLELAYKEQDKTAFYTSIPRCQKIAQITNMFLNTWATVAESQKKIEALRQELGV